MTMRVLKTWPEYWEAVARGHKTFEYRKDDREPPFAVEDFLMLLEWDPKTEEYTGRAIEAVVTYVARGGVIPEGHCAMSIVVTTINRRYRYERSFKHPVGRR